MNHIEYYVKKVLKRGLNKLNIHALDKFLIIPFMTVREFDRLVSIMKNNRNKIYIEHGCGGSTVFANKYFREYYSCDTDNNFVQFLNKVMKKNKVEHIDVGAIREWGYPLEASVENAEKISRHFEVLRTKERKDDYIVFIDGRCRVLTALNYVQSLKPGDLLMVHDYNKREEYRSILDFFDVVEHVDTLIVLKIKQDVDQEKLKNQKKAFSQNFI